MAWQEVVIRCCPMQPRRGSSTRWTGWTGAFCEKADTQEEETRHQGQENSKEENMNNVLHWPAYWAQNCQLAPFCALFMYSWPKLLNDPFMCAVMFISSRPKLLNGPDYVVCKLSTNELWWALCCYELCIPQLAVTLCHIFSFNYCKDHRGVRP